MQGTWLTRVKADIRNPLRYLLITHIMSEFISLMIQASPYPLLIAPRNPAGDLPDSVKKGAGQYTFCIVRRLNDSVKSGAPSSHKKQRATAHKSIHLRHVFPYVGIIQIRFQVKTIKSTLSPSI